MQETTQYREFSRLCQALVQLNEKISDLRPVVEIEDKNEREALKKKLQMIFRKKLKRR
jgi:acetolactate synthase small subunit